MNQKDFVFLNVEKFIHRPNASPQWQEIARSLTRTQIDFFQDYGLLRPDAPALHSPLEGVIIKFSDFTPEGQQFIMTAATDKWLQACDKKKTLEAYKDPSGLVKRLKKFREQKDGKNDQRH